MKFTTLSVIFNGQTLYLVEHHREPYTPMKPIVEGMGLDWKTESDELTCVGDTHHAGQFCVRLIPMHFPGDQQQREMLCIPLCQLSAWLCSISSTKFKESIRAQVEMYQQECNDVLWQCWSMNRRKQPKFNLATVAKDFAAAQRLARRFGFSLHQSRRVARLTMRALHDVDPLHILELPEPQKEPISSPSKFIKNCITTRPDGHLASKDLLSAFRDFCVKNNLPLASKHELFRTIKDQIPAAWRCKFYDNGRRRWGFAGIMLSTDTLTPAREIELAMQAQDIARRGPVADREFNEKEVEAYLKPKHYK